MACRKAGFDADAGRAALGRLDRRAAPGRRVPLGRRHASACPCRRSVAAPTCARRSSARRRCMPVRAGEIGVPPARVRRRGVHARRRALPARRHRRTGLTAPMPSMPVGFWGDADGSTYRAAYFEDFPGVWRHGDWVTFTEDGACIDHRAVRRHAQPRRRAPRHERLLRRGRGVRRGCRQPRRPRRGRARRRRARASCCCSSRWRPGACSTTTCAPASARALRDRAVAAPRPGRDRGRADRAAHAVGQEAGGAGEAHPRRRAGRRAASRDSLADPDALSWYVDRAAYGRSRPGRSR